MMGSPLMNYNYTSFNVNHTLYNSHPVFYRLLLLLTNLHLKLLSTQGTGADKLLSIQRVKIIIDLKVFNILTSSRECCLHSVMFILQTCLPGQFEMSTTRCIYEYSGGDMSTIL